LRQTFYDSFGQSVRNSYYRFDLLKFRISQRHRFGSPFSRFIQFCSQNR